jgi:DNA-binding protein YbaB
MAKANAKKAEASVLRMGVAASDGGFHVKIEMRGEWQNLSIWISESVILGE